MEKYLKNPFNQSRLTYFRNVLIPLYKPNVLSEVLKSGQSNWRSVISKDISDPFEFYRTNPELLLDLMYSMHHVNKNGNTEIADWLFKNLSELNTIIDIGGATGSLADSIINRTDKQIEYVIYEKADAQTMIQKLNERIYEDKNLLFKYVWGDFLKDTDNSFYNLEGHKADAIIFSWIIHDWSNSTSIQLLHKAKKHLNNGGKIILIEKLLDNDRVGPQTISDVDMLLQNLGKERTFSDYKEIVESAGLKITKTHFPENGRDIMVLE